MAKSLRSRLALFRTLCRTRGIPWPTAAVVLIPSRLWPPLQRVGLWARIANGLVELRLPNGDTLAVPRSVRNAAARAAHMYLGIVCADQYRVSSLVAAGDVVIDCGAFVGAFSLLASRAVGQEGRVVAIEPIAPSLDALRRTMGANGCRNVDIVPAALLATPGEVLMHVDPGHLGRSTACAERRTAEHSQEMLVRAKTVDGVVSELNLSHVELIKMDVEGCEGEVLSGARETIRSLHPVIVMSA